MGKSHKQISELDLEGRFLGFLVKKGEKRKEFGLATSFGELLIKLDTAKAERIALQTQLTPGDWVRVVGEKSLNLKNGKLKLTADRVICTTVAKPAETVSSQESAPSCPLEQNCAIAATCSQVQPETSAGESTEKQKKATILICQKSDCRKRGGAAFCQALEEHLRQEGLEDKVTIKGTGCMKRCKAGPNAIVMPDKTRYSKIQPQEIPQLIANHF